MNQNGAVDKVGSSSAPESFRLYFHYCLLGGLCPLIPVPFIDEWALNRVRKSLVSQILLKNGIELTKNQIKYLVYGFDEKKGCMKTLITLPFVIFWKVVLYPLKRMFKKLVFILILKESSEAVSRLFHHSCLLEHAIKNGYLRKAGNSGNEKNVLPVNRAIEVTLSKVDTRPFNQIVKRSLSGSKKLLRGAAGRFGRVLRNKVDHKNSDDSIPNEFNVNGEHVNDDEWNSLLSELSDEIWLNQDYLTDLCDKFNISIQEEMSQGTGKRK